MATYTVKDWQGDAAGTASLELQAANPDSAAHILHRAVVRHQARARQGNACTKTRAEVRGGGRKPWRQKGTGRARAGSIRSPLWRGGGVIFGPKPRDYDQKLNRKERRLALRTALSSRAGDTLVVADFNDQLARPKTKELAQALRRWGIADGEKVLLVVAEKTESVYLSSRNLPTVNLVLASQLNVYDVLNADKIAIAQSALAMIQEVYGE